MHIDHDASRNMFVARSDDGTKMGEIVYDPRDDRVIAATHTGTEMAYRGQGVAGKLLDALVEYAVDNNLKIVPVCPYVVNAFKKDPEKYAAVLETD